MAERRDDKAAARDGKKHVPARGPLRIIAEENELERESPPGGALRPGEK